MYSLSSLLVLFGALLLRWCVSLHNYSGHATPPMFGDYEAQRHWMEITRNLPARDWYSNTTNNNLLYWGLDYPPLTAYHSLLCGYVAEYIDPSFVALQTSRGFENYHHKLFMRATVLVADILVYIPAVWWFFASQRRNLEPGESQNYLLSIFFALVYPGLILIDHGHFQYNCVSLGLFVSAVTALTLHRDLFGSVLFCMALNYKQMELYHALPFFCYLFGSSLKVSPRMALASLALIGTTVTLTFLAVWLPFLRNSQVALQVLVRLFPLARGVFEDKVANVWCVVNVAYKLREAFTNESMARVCLLTTLVAVTPSCLDLLLRPTLQKFRVSLINVSLAFFLFSFQVHEKSILLVAVPMLLHLPEDPLMCFWFLMVSTFSMMPLLIKDGLLIPSLALSLFYAVAFNLVAQKESSRSPSKYPKKQGSPSTGSRSGIVSRLFAMSMAGCLVLTICSAALKPPERYPDIFPLVVSVYSCLHFAAFFVYFNCKQILWSNNKAKLKLH